MKNNYISQQLATSKLFFACILCFLLAGVSTTVNAQNVSVTGANGIADNTTYLNLGKAFDAINAQTNQSGKNIEIKISGNIDEDQNNGSTLNAGTWTTLKIYPTATAIVTGPENLGNNNAVINLNGADNVTIDGRLNQTGASALTLQALGLNSVNVIKFINAATLNTVKYCTLKGNSKNTDCGIIHFSTDGTTGSGNDNNTIDNCNITSVSNTARPTYTIYSAGTSSKENNSNTISNNNFYNLWNPDSTSYGIYIASYSNSFTISGNNFYETTTAPSSGYSFSFVNILTGNNYSITNNYMGGSAALCSGPALSVLFPGKSSLVSFIPINLSVGTTAPATLVQGNTISNINFLSTVPEFSAIKVTAGNVDINNNTIGSSTGTQSIKIATDEQNNATTTAIINITSTNVVNITNNIIGSIYAGQTNNKPHNLYGIYNNSGDNLSKVTNNYVYNLIVSSTNSGSYIVGIGLMSGKINCFNNIVNLGENVTQPTMIYGIWDDGATTLTSYVYHNTIYINGTVSPSAQISKTCAYYKNNNTSTTIVNNNIFSNMRIGGTTEYNYAMYLNSADNSRLTIDYNNYYVNTATNRGMLGYAGGGTRTDIAGIRVGTGQDAQSISILPPFRQASTTLATDFKLTTQMAGTKGTNNVMLTTVPDDFGRPNIRATPTMGAWEFKKNYWKGSTGNTDPTDNTKWTKLTNWTGGFIPSEDEDVEFADGTNSLSAALNHLLLDTDRKIRNLIINTNKRLEIPIEKCLNVTGTISTGTNTDRILIKSAPDAKNGSLIFPNATNVYGSVEMYSKAYIDSSPTAANDQRYFWQYFGIPITTITASPTLDGAYIRRSYEAGNEDDATYYWTELTNSDPIDPFIGYEICQPSKGIYTFKGQLVNTDFDTRKLPLGLLPLTNEQNYPGHAGKYPGQHLFANPYTAAININKIEFGADVEETIFLHNTGSYGQWLLNGGETSNGEKAGQYVSVPKNAANILGIPAEVPSMSSMLVKTTGDKTTGSYITFNYKDVATKNTTVQRVKAADAVSNTDLVATMLDLYGQHYSDRMWIFTEPTCTRNFDNGWDGRKILGSSLAPQIYAIEPDGDYQVNSVSDMHDTDLAFQAGDEVEYTIKFTHQNIQQRYAGVYLVDLVENKTIDVTQNGSTYKFATAQSDVPTKRFKIITRYYEKNAPDTKSQLKIFSAKSTVYIQNLGTLDGNCALYNIAGQVVRNLSFGPGSLTTVSNLRQGAYVIRATTNGEKVSKRVIVQ